MVGELLRRHENDRVLVIGQYLDQLRTLSALFDMPLITGQTNNMERDRLYAAFHCGELPHLIVSKTTFAVDIPDANVAIQVSGTFGSRQEEAQRLGRVCGPSRTAATFTVVSESTREQEFAAKRQLFLTEQGCAYEISASGAPLAIRPGGLAVTD